MADDDRLSRFVRNIRSAGRQLSDARRAYTDGKRAARVGLPRDEAGRAQIVCRRYAERRAVSLDAELRPACFEADHPDCRGCAEDIRSGDVESWG